jgi:hypothetical protein
MLFNKSGKQEGRTKSGGVGVEEDGGVCGGTGRRRGPNNVYTYE